MSVTSIEKIDSRRFGWALILFRHSNSNQNIILPDSNNYILIDIS